MIDIDKTDRGKVACEMHPKLGMLFLKQAQSWTSFIAISILAIILSSTSGRKTVQHQQQHEHPLINHINWPKNSQDFHGYCLWPKNSQDFHGYHYQLAQEFPRIPKIFMVYGKDIGSSSFVRFFGSIVGRLLEALDPSSAERFLQLVDDRLGPQAPNPSWWFWVLMGQK